MDFVLSDVLDCLAAVEDVELGGSGFEEGWREEVAGDHHVCQHFRQHCVQEFNQIIGIEMWMFAHIGVFLLALLGARLDKPNNIISNIVQIDNKLLIGTTSMVQPLDNNLIQPNILPLLRQLKNLNPLSQHPQYHEAPIHLRLIFLHAIGAVLQGEDLLAEGAFVLLEEGLDVLEGLFLGVEMEV